MSSTKSAEATTPTESTKPIWATGPEQITVELLFGKMYNIDVDIAKRMNIIHEARTSKETVAVTACSTTDFENALTFCANDRTCSQPPTPELARIMSEMDPTSTTPAPASASNVPTTGQPFTELALNEDEDEADESYHPSSDSSASDSADEYSDTDLADIGTAELRAERKTHGSPEPQPEIEDLAQGPRTRKSLSGEPTTAAIAQGLANLQLGEESDPEDEEYVPSSESSASDSGDEYSNTDAADVGTAEIKAERDEFEVKQGA